MTNHKLILIVSLLNDACSKTQTYFQILFNSKKLYLASNITLTMCPLINFQTK